MTIWAVNEQLSEDVWKYFTKSQDKKLAKCNTCGKEYRTSGNTSNLLDHLARFHPNCEDKEQETAETCTSTSSSSCQSSMRSVSSYFKRAIEYESDSKRKKDIDCALRGLITGGYQPFNIVREESFKTFVRVLDPRYVLPCAKTLRDVLLKNQYNNCKLKLKSILSKIEHVSITTDTWTSVANESYLTVTCHFIMDFALKCCVLSTNKLGDPTNHTATNIANSLQIILDDWEVFSKVRCIVTDNASVMGNACGLLKKSHLGCYAHSLNLVVQDGLSQNAELLKLQITCKKIVTFFKLSTIAYEKFRNEQMVECPYSLIQDTKTRWNSTYFMFQRILKTNDAISKVLLSTMKAPQPLSPYSIKVLTEVVDLLQVFQDATEQISGDSYVTISLIIPTTYVILEKLHLKSFHLTTVEGSTLCSALTASVCKRLTPYETRTIPRMGTILHPRFKKEGFQSANNANEAAKCIEQELVAVIANKTLTSTSEHTRSSPKNTFFEFVEKRLEEKRKSSKADAIILLRQYFERHNISQDASPLLAWKFAGDDLEPFKKLALKYFCTPATSVESERIFSKAGLVITDRRSRLKPKHVDKIIFLNKNTWLLSN